MLRRHREHTLSRTEPGLQRNRVRRNRTEVGALDDRQVAFSLDAFDSFGDLADPTHFYYGDGFLPRVLLSAGLAL